MLISSMMSRSMVFIMLLFSLLNANLDSILAPGMKGCSGSWKNEWIVTPPAFMAAMPVGATTTTLFLDSSTTFRRNVVFPVPAFPVRKTLFPVFSTNSHAVFSALFPSISLSSYIFSKYRQKYQL